MAMFRIIVFAVSQCAIGPAQVRTSYSDTGQYFRKPACSDPQPVSIDSAMGDQLLNLLLNLC